MTATIRRACLLSLLLLSGAILSPVACAYTATGNLPLQFEPAGSTWDTVVADAAAQSTPATPPGSLNPSPGGTPVYHSTKLEETTLEGDFTADANTTSLAIFSDDGCDVSIGPDVDHLTNIWNRRDQAQALPDLLNSLHVLPITLVAGSTYHIRVGYSNVIYTGDGDIDGVTLFTWANPPAAVVPFSLSVSPTTVTLPVGGSGSTTVTVTGISGFADTVSLGAYDLPPGVTASFAPASVQATGTSTLAFTVSQSTTPGSYSVTISGTYKGVHLTIPLTLNVTDFTLSANPSTLAIPPGGSRATTISMTPLYGFSGSVPLTVSGAPTGMITGLSPTSVSVGNGSVLTISTAPSVVRDTYTLTVSGVANGLTRIATVTVKISDPQVTVTISNLQDVYVGSPVTATATASVDPLPGGYSASDLVATWSPYTTAYIEYSLTGTDDLWNDPGDGSTAGVTLNGAATDPAGTFTGTFNTLGFYEACIGATVSFRNPTTGENFGPYTGYGFATNDGYAASAATPNLAMVDPALSPMGAPPLLRQPKVATRQVSGYISIEGQLDPNGPGGLVVPNFDGNGAARQPITISWAGPAAWARQPNSYNNSIKLLANYSGKGTVEIYTTPRGGSPMAFDGTSNVIPATKLPMTLYVAGIHASSTMRDVILSAQAITSGKAGGIGTARFTVLWVNDIITRLSPNDGLGPTFLIDDPAAGNYYRDYGTKHIGGPQIIGGNKSFLPFFSWVYEAIGQVNPSNFSYPYTGVGDPKSDSDRHDVNYNRLHLARDVEAHFYSGGNYKGGDVYQSDLSEEFNSRSPSPNDTTLYVYQSPNTSPGGNIYDIDGPGLNINYPFSDWSNNEIRRLRFNGREFAEILAQGTPTRCSRITGFYVRLSVVNVDGTFGAVNNVPNDNRAGLGITPVTYDMKPAPPANISADISAGGRTITLKWSPSESATSYNVYQTSGGGAGPYSTTATEYTLVNLQPGTPYSFRVTGVDAFGEGSRSTEANATTN